MSKSSDFLHYPKFRDGDEPFRQGRESKGFCLYDYWRWMGSDLVMNIQRGVVAEFIVANALGAETLNYPRSPWEGFDVQVSDNEMMTIEVKSAAYVQAWHRKNSKPSTISFGITPKKYGRDFHVDAYVFCVLGRQCACPDPLDLDQWRFYVLMSAVLDEEVPDQKRIGIRKLEELVDRRGQYAANYDGLREAVDEAFRRDPPKGGTFS